MTAWRIPRCAAVLASLCVAELIIACSQPPGSAPSSPAAPSPSAAPSSPPAPAPPEATLDQDNRALLAQARRSRQPVVILLVAIEPDRIAETTAGLEELGGIVGASGPTAGCLRVSLPTENVERAAALPAVTAVDIDQLIPRDNPRPQGTPP